MKRNLLQYWGAACVCAALCVFLLAIGAWWLPLVILVGWLAVPNKLWALFAGAVAAACLALPGLSMIWYFWPDWWYDDIWGWRFMLSIFFVLFIVFVYYVVKPVMWPEYEEIDQSEGSWSLDDVAPQKGKPIRTIQQEGVKRREIVFLFGMADHELVERLGIVGKTLVAVAKRKAHVRAIIGLILLLFPIVFFFGTGAWEGMYKRDVERMWRVQTLPDGEVVSTPEAMKAAVRVFSDDVRMRALTREQLSRLLKTNLMDPRYKLNRSKYPWDTERFFARIGDGRTSIVLYVAFGQHVVLETHWAEEPFTKNDGLEQPMEEPKAAKPRAGVPWEE